MIFDHLVSAPTYQNLGPRFERGFRYLKTFQPETPDGKHELDGENLYALVQSFQTMPAAERTFEAHLAYADIHFIVSGSEWIYYAQTPRLIPKTEYDRERDVTFFEDQDDYGFSLDTGHFTILWPQDAHKPGCIHNGSGSQAVRKVVLKIKL